jgi:ABC-type antimicrobial peptide transport system permease subunit
MGELGYVGYYCGVRFFSSDYYRYLTENYLLIVFKNLMQSSLLTIKIYAIFLHSKYFVFRIIKMHVQIPINFLNSYTHISHKSSKEKVRVQESNLDHSLWNSSILPLYQL